MFFNYSISNIQTTDPRGLITSYNYGLIPPPKEEEPHILFNDSPDAGKRYLLNDVTQKPSRRWNSLNFVYRHEYDDLQRPTELWVTPDGASEYLAENFIYGESQGAALNYRGQLYESFDQAGKITFTEYDFKGNALQQEQQFAEEYKTTVDHNGTVNYESKTFSTEWEFDALNRPISEITPDTSEKLYSYAPSALLNQVKINVRDGASAADAITAINYNARGQRIEVFYANGSKTTNTYDVATFRLRRILSSRNTGADILQDLNYTFDAVGNIVHLKDDAQQTIYFSNSVVVPENKYEYDALYRLTKAEGRQLVGLNAAPSNADIQIKNPVPDSDTSAMEKYTRTYTYDSNGNMTKMQNVAGSSWTKDFYYESSSNRLDRHSDPGSSEYNYDEHGNLIDGTNIIGLTYNENDQIVEADLSGGGTAYYRYDSGGERIRKVVINGVNKKERLYLNNFEIYRESISGSVDLERETVYANDDQKRFLQLDTLTKDIGTPIGTPTTEWRYQFDNNIGSACLELDDTAAVISYEEYFPFGATAYHSGKSEAEVKHKRFRYTGKERDEETGLYYYGARYYAPWLARFTSTDPMGMVDGASLYAYVRNNPIKLNDPDGMQAGGEDEEETKQETEEKSLRKYKKPSGGSLITDGISNPFYAEDITAKTKAKDSEGNALEVDVLKGSLLAFTFEGERYTARFGTSSGKFTRYANQKGETFEYGIDTDRLQSIDITFSELNSDHGILSGYMEIAENSDVLFGGKKFFFSTLVQGFDTRELGASVSGESSSELKGKLFFEDNLQDFENLLENIEIELTEQSISTPLKLGTAEAGMLTIKGSKNFSMTFYATNYKVSLSSGFSLNPTPVDFSSKRGKKGMFKLVTPVTKEDSIQIGLK